MQLRISKHTYPDLTDSELDIMKTEIEANLKKGEDSGHEPDFKDNNPK